MTSYHVEFDADRQVVTINIFTDNGNVFTTMITGYSVPILYELLAAKDADSKALREQWNSEYEEMSFTRSKLRDVEAAFSRLSDALADDNRNRTDEIPRLVGAINTILNTYPVPS